MLFAIRLLKLHLLLPLSLIGAPSCLSFWSVKACPWVPCFAVFCFYTFLGCLCSSRQGICPWRDRCEFCRRLLILYYTLLPFSHQGSRQFLSSCLTYEGCFLIFWDLIPGFRTAECILKPSGFLGDDLQGLPCTPAGLPVFEFYGEKCVGFCQYSCFHFH